MVRVAVSAVYDTLSGFPGLSDNVPVVEEEIFEKDACWDLRYLTSKTNGDPSARSTSKLYSKTMVYPFCLMFRLYKFEARTRCTSLKQGRVGSFEFHC